MEYHQISQFLVLWPRCEIFASQCVSKSFRLSDLLRLETFQSWWRGERSCCMSPPQTRRRTLSPPQTHPRRRTQTASLSFEKFLHHLLPPLTLSPAAGLSSAVPQYTICPPPPMIPKLSKRTQENMNVCWMMMIIKLSAELPTFPPVHQSFFYLLCPTLTIPHFFFELLHNWRGTKSCRLRPKSPFFPCLQQALAHPGKTTTTKEPSVS